MLWSKHLIRESMGMVFIEIPNLVANLLASVTEPSELQGDGISSAETFFEPNAAQAITATNAESMPPLRPRITLVNPHLCA